VEFRSVVSIEYRVAAASQLEEMTSARDRCAAEVSHAEKLLRDLPAALENSVSASSVLAEKMLDGDDGDLSELGTMMLEQQRIRREITRQQLILHTLDSTPLPGLDQEQFETRSVWAKIILRFHEPTDIEDKRYRVVRTSELPAVSPKAKWKGDDTSAVTATSSAAAASGSAAEPDVGHHSEEQ
jgi:hypothetical protein